MTIAQQKLEENIAEYIIYVWQMQDLLRSVDLEHDKLFERLGLNQKGTEEEVQWLKSLAQKMKQEGVEASGHVTEIQTILAELFFLHNTLIDILKDTKYQDLFSKSEPHISGLMQKSTGQQNLIEHVLIAIYGLLILRLQKKEISQETLGAMNTFSNQLAYLSVKYKEMKTGELNSGKN